MAKSDILVPLVDGGIYNIETDQEHWDGCETCDYGSRYIDRMTVRMLHATIEVDARQMYEYPLSEGYLMRLLLQNLDFLKTLTERRFYVWLKGKLEAAMGAETRWGQSIDVTWKEA